jgi:mono/diheme cytochrome c family protein
MKKKGLSWWLWVLIIGIVVFGLIQLVPYGKTHVNPPVVNSPKWDSVQTEALARASCYDCHSNETTYPWYSNVAPASWLLQRDVDEGRRRLNFSEWPTDAGKQQAKIDEIQEVLIEGEMPPIQYTLIHPKSKLSSEQINQLVNGLLSGVTK